MLSKETLKLLNTNTKDFRNIFSICIGKTYLFQRRFIDYIGKYNRWDTNVKNGTLKLDYKLFNVEYIGTTSKTDNFWYSSELEKIIPGKYVKLMNKTIKNMKSLNLEELTEGKIILENDINGYNLSMIYIAFAPENVAYFCGSGDTSIYMFVKKLPKDIFKKMNSTEFSSCVMEIISTFNVDHKLMVKALLIENEIENFDNGNNLIAKFNDNSILTIEFDDRGVLKRISGNLSL